MGKKTLQQLDTIDKMPNFTGFPRNDMISIDLSIFQMEGAHSTFFCKPNLYNI